MGDIVFKGSNFVLMDISSELPRHRNFPYGANDILQPWDNKPAVKSQYYLLRKRLLNKMYCHQTAGGVKAVGRAAVEQTAQFSVNDPAWAKNYGKWSWTGRGRGWPAIPYTYFLPYAPEVAEDRWVIYKCHNEDWVTWHSSDNKNSVAIACQGYFKSRHIKNFVPASGCNGHPSDLQREVLEAFLVEYGALHLSITPTEILGHCDSPKPKLTCPGDDIEKMLVDLHHWRDADNKSHVWAGTESERPIHEYNNEKFKFTLGTWEKRQAALVFIGHDLGEFGPKKNGVDGEFGYHTRLAIEAQERVFGLPEDGMWDDRFEFILSLYLRGLGVTSEDLEALMP